MSSSFSLVRPGEVPSDLICPICMCLPLDPCILEPCEHFFCQDCVTTSLLSTTNLQQTSGVGCCPIDRIDCRLDQIRPLKNNNNNNTGGGASSSSFVYRIWSNVQVQCENCTIWRGSIADFSQHEQSTKCRSRRDNITTNTLSSEKELEYLHRIEQLTLEVSLLQNNQREIESNNRQLRIRNEELTSALEAKNHALRTTVDVLSSAIVSSSSSASSVPAVTTTSAVAANQEDDMNPSNEDEDENSDITNSKDEDEDDKNNNNNKDKENSYDRTSILQLVQQMCQNLETRPVDCSADELFDFARCLYEEMKKGQQQEQQQQQQQQHQLQTNNSDRNGGNGGGSDTTTTTTTTTRGNKKPSHNTSTFHNQQNFRDDVKLILGVVGASSWFTRPQRAVVRRWCEEQGWGN